MKHRLSSVAVVFVLAVAASNGSAPQAATAVCVGDCQGTGTGDINSLVTMVGIALGSAPLSSCPHGVPSGTPVTVALIIQAVNNTLSGCPGSQATPTTGARATGTFTPTPTVGAPSGSTPCPVGQHRVCHGGSGRGGGYRTTCTCVDNPPPVCVTAWGTSIQEGTSLVLYDTQVVYAPDTCSAHGTLVSCGANGALSPPNATGYPFCGVVYDGGGPD